MFLKLRLPQAHCKMIAKGFGPKMELKRGYLQVLREAASASSQAKRGGGGENMQFI